ncbi:MAG: energy transducer TonB [Gammaproteobacteria bacterium]
MTVIAERPPIGSGDRLAMTACLAILVHAIVILGVGFAPELPPPPRFDTMDIVLVPQQGKAPDEAAYLAQANLTGGGDSQAPARPTTPLVAPIPTAREMLAVPAASGTDATPYQAPPRRAAVQTGRSETPSTGREVEDAAEVRTARESEREVPQPATPAAAAPVPAAGDARDTQASRETPTADQLIASSFAIASLSAEIQQRLDARAQAPRRKFITASTREYRYAAYMESWRAKVERIGNLNYPDEARRNKLTGSLILEVVLDQDGKVKDMIVRRSSGFAVLDDAAMRIVQLAGPYAPFPPDIARETDVLHITRTWQFQESSGFRSN